MRIGLGLDTSGTVDDVVARAVDLAATGVGTLWLNQIFGWDALTALAVVGRAVPDVGLGTAVVPVQPRHPVVMASQALTAQSAVGGRLTLGIGLSHQLVIENVFGIRWERQVDLMEEYLEVLVPLLAGDQVTFQGELVRASTFGPLEAAGAEPPPVLVAALGPRMLDVAGRLAAGTVTWMVGPRTVADHVAPTIARAASAAGRPEPRVEVHLPVCVTADVDAARRRAAHVFGMYGTLPSYRAMLDREGAAGPEDVAVIGDEAAVEAALARVGEAGATGFGAVLFGSADEVARGRALMAALAGRR